MTYRDAAGRTLEDYPRPSVAVDTAVLTVVDGRLCVLLVGGADAGAERSEGSGEGLSAGSVSSADAAPAWRLPGTFVHPGETLADAVARSLRDKAGVEGLRPEQLHVFDDPARDDRGWVLSVAHLDVVRAGRVPAGPGNRLVPVEDVPALPFDHEAIIGFAVDALRARYDAEPDPFALVEAAEEDGSFTLRELRLVHEAVAGRALLPDTFRRTMRPLLVETGRMSAGRRGKPAELYRRRTD